MLTKPVLANFAKWLGIGLLWGWFAGDHLFVWFVGMVFFTLWAWLEGRYGD